MVLGVFWFDLMVLGRDWFRCSFSGVCLLFWFYGSVVLHGLFDLMLDGGFVCIWTFGYWGDFVVCFSWFAFWVYF